MVSTFKRSLLNLQRSLPSKNQIRWPEESFDLSTKDGGGYYPAKLGEQLNGRYAIRRKLGWSQLFNTWLAKDEKRDKYVMLKILSASLTARPVGPGQLAVLKHLDVVKKKSTHPGRDHVMTLLDHFKLTSQHGEHQVLVGKPIGNYLNDVYQLNDERFPVWLVKKVARQMLMAIDFLHYECEVVHTDIKPNSIYFTVTDDDVEAALEKDDIKVESKLPEGAVLSRRISNLTAEDVSNPSRSPPLQVKLVDFEVASLGLAGPKVIQPIALRAPEVILGVRWTYSTDIWNFGCVIAELLIRGKWLFRPKAGDKYAAEHAHLVQMNCLFGEDFERECFQQGYRYDYFFHKDGQIRVPGRLQSMQDILEVYKVFENDDELKLCLSFLQSALRINPSDRMNASQLLQHQWLKEDLSSSS